MSAARGLFSASLISKDVSDSLPQPYTIRPLERGDYARGFFDVLRVLTHVGDVTEQKFQERFDWMDTQAKGSYFFLVIDDGKRIVATGVLVVERKFIHDFGIVGHIEEISVLKEEQGKHLGLKMIQALDSVAANVGCYKCILNCSEENEGFYLRCGYHKGGTEMAHYFEEEKSAYERG